MGKPGEPHLDKTKGKYIFTILLWESIAFEWKALVVTLLAFSQYQFMHFTIQKLENKDYREEVLLLQNYEVQMMHNPDMTIEEKEDPLGQKYKNQKKEKERIEKEKEEKARLLQKYRDEMHELSSKFPKNFIDCRWFQRKTDTFFVLTLIS